MEPQFSTIYFYRQYISVLAWSNYIWIAKNMIRCPFEIVKDYDVWRSSYDTRTCRWSCMTLVIWQLYQSIRFPSLNTDLTKWYTQNYSSQKTTEENGISLQHHHLLYHQHRHYHYYHHHQHRHYHYYHHHQRRLHYHQDYYCFKYYLVVGFWSL